MRPPVIESCVGECGKTGPVRPGHPALEGYLCPECRRATRLPHGMGAESFDIGVGEHPRPLAHLAADAQPDGEAFDPAGVAANQPGYVGGAMQGVTAHAWNSITATCSS